MTLATPLLPTFYLPGENGEVRATTGSRALIRRFEREFEGRSVVPADPAPAFPDELLGGTRSGSSPSRANPSS